MNNLEEKIFEITKSEQWHLDHPGKLSPVYSNMQTEERNGRKCYRFDFPNTLNSYTAGILKETRFTEIPFHYHTDMEMNYIYSGSCTFVINGKEVTLTQGDICILDADVVHHAAYKEESDIVFNIVFTKAFFRAKFVNWIGKQGLLGKFIVSAISESHSHDKYLIFHTDPSKQELFASNRLKSVLDLLIQEHFYPSLYSGELLEHYLSIVFLLLIHSITTDAEEYFRDNKENQIIVTVLDYLEKNYYKDSCRLQNIADTLHFSESHLYQLIKKGTGITFSQLKIKQQMQQAALLLKTTNLPVLSIAEEVGCKNRTYFYEKFKEVYQMTPAEYRGEDQG